MIRRMTQLAVNTENRAGALADLTETLVDADVNLIAVYAPDTAGNFGMVRILPDKVEEARQALQRAGYTSTPVEVLVIEMSHRPGALAEVARVLARNQVFIRYAYASIQAGADRGLCIVRVDDVALEHAKGILEKRLG